MNLIFGRTPVVDFVSLPVFVAVSVLCSILAPKFYIFVKLTLHYDISVG